MRAANLRVEGDGVEDMWSSFGVDARSWRAK